MGLLGVTPGSKGGWCKPFGQGWAAIDTGPTEVLRPSTQVSSDAGLIVLEDDIFLEGLVETPSAESVPVQHPSQAEELVRRSQ